MELDIKNNKEIPGNAEELEVFKNIVHIITLFAKKMISLTSSDMCPIDYVVCNKAGILENGYFENKFERINDVLFKEPVNIYGDDWQEFVHMYDGQEQLLQEVPYDPDHSFTTDFGCNYPALLIASRDNKALVSPRDISLEDQPAIYERPRKNIVTYIGDEITDSVLEKINRIRALNCFVGTPEEQEKKKQEFHLLQNADGINNITIGEDWFILVDNNGIFRTVYASDKNVKSYKEAQDTLKSYIFTEEVDPDGVKIYKLIGALDPVVKKI